MAKYTEARLRAEIELRELGLMLQRRDEIVKAAYIRGTSKNAIYEITGLARTTIDRILDA